VVLVAAGLAACGDSPEVGGAAAVRSMVLEACAPGGDAVQTDICTCAYDALADRFDGEALESLDRELRDDPETVPAAVQEAVLECSFEQVAPPTSKPTTTSTSSTTTVPDDEDADDDDADDEDATTTTRRP
jgi:hypothetical protein